MEWHFIKFVLNARLIWILGSIAIVKKRRKERRNVRKSYLERSREVISLHSIGFQRGWFHEKTVQNEKYGITKI